MTARYIVLATLITSGLTAVQGATPASPSPAERSAIFKAAGGVQRGGKWLLCTEDPQAQGAAIERYGDLNGDGRPEAVITEGGTFCYGFTGAGFQLLSKQADGNWKRITGDIGIPEFLTTKGVGSWPDISIGGPGFCFPVQRWNGKEYVVQRHEYEGKPCKMQR